jgi:hypothetical protein
MFRLARGKFNVSLEIVNLKGLVYFTIQPYYLIISAVVAIQIEIGLFIENKTLYFGPQLYVRCPKLQLVGYFKFIAFKSSLPA